jgi:hypothetical protein
LDLEWIGGYPRLGDHVAQILHLRAAKNTLTSLSKETLTSEYLEYNLQLFHMFFQGRAVHQDVVKEDENEFS